MRKSKGHKKEFLGGRLPNWMEIPSFFLFIGILILISRLWITIQDNFDNVISWIFGALALIRWIIKRPLIVICWSMMIYGIVKFIKRAWYHGE